ncbi:MAG TPA: DUF4279 domain-containing protein [Pseudomonadales bacterium]|nr:DUF4279 domain-containing protein [Pseudomonadales bacterium]
MAHLSRSVASLRVFGDQLIPEEITKLLGSEPTKSTRKGDVIPSASHARNAKTGSWLLKAKSCEPENLNEQVEWILSQLTSDLGVWSALCKEFEVDIFCGLFMEGSNEGFSLSPAIMSALGSRGIEIGFDIYDSAE